MIGLSDDDERLIGECWSIASAMKFFSIEAGAFRLQDEHEMRCRDALVSVLFMASDRINALAKVTERLAGKMED